jgi:quercetin dioxygenase-like cupin family protein
MPPVRNRPRLMNDDDRLERPSFLGKPLPPAFELRVVTIPPGGVRAFHAAEWRDALVVVERGAIELETRQGRRRTFATGDMLCLIGLSLRALHNQGHEAVSLVAVSRRRHKSSVPPP